jgi:hypothetical protein
VISWGTASMKRMPSGKLPNLLRWEYFSGDSSNDIYIYLHVHCIFEAEFVIPRRKSYCRSFNCPDIVLDVCFVSSVRSNRGVPLYIHLERGRVRDNSAIGKLVVFHSLFERD